jgi:hypothetical protein
MSENMMSQNSMLFTVDENKGVLVESIWLILAFNMLNSRTLSVKHFFTKNLHMLERGFDMSILVIIMSVSHPLQKEVFSESSLLKDFLHFFLNILSLCII